MRALVYCNFLKEVRLGGWGQTRRGGLSIGLRGAIAQGHHNIGGTTLADCSIDILVAYIIFLQGT